MKPITKSFLARLTIFVISILFLGSLMSNAAQTTSAGRARTIRWIVAHDRHNPLFSRLIEKFSQDLKTRSNGKLNVKVVHFDHLSEAADSAGLKQVLNGAADMSQISIANLGRTFPDSNLNALDMPFVFRSYEHAAAVFGSPIGKRLIDGLSAASGKKIKGFAFTFSGGYRILFGKVPVKQVSDLKNVRVRTSGGLGRSAFFQNLGANVVDLTIDETSGNPLMSLISDKIDLDDPELNRVAIFYHDYPEIAKRFRFASLTRHSLYMTEIIANEKFFSSLTGEQQGLLTEETEKLATAERDLSVELEKKNRALLASKGVQFSELSETDRQILAGAGEAIHKTVAPELRKTVQEIQVVKEAP